jgi:transcriptional regulator with XRE-family HTH domain
MSADAPVPVLSFPLPNSPALDRPRPMRRPHEPATVAAVRLFYERSTLTYAEIARRTGVSPASVSRYAQAGGWRRPPGAPKATAFANGLPSPRLKGRMLARRLRDLCGRYLDDMERQPDPRDMPDCDAVLAMLRMAREAERRKPRRPLAARARALAERYLDHLERAPEPDLEGLAWVLKMIETAREEEAMARSAQAVQDGAGRRD